MLVAQRRHWKSEHDVDLISARHAARPDAAHIRRRGDPIGLPARHVACLLYTSDAADERSSVDLGGRRIIKKKTEREIDPLVLI